MSQTFEQPESNDEEMTVTLDLEDGSSVECAIVTILTVNNQDYIALLLLGLPLLLQLGKMPLNLGNEFLCGGLYRFKGRF